MNSLPSGRMTARTEPANHHGRVRQVVPYDQGRASIRSSDVIETLAELKKAEGVPRHIYSYNGSEFATW